MNKKSKAMTVVGVLFFFLGGIAWLLLALAFPEYERFAVPVAAILAAIGGFMLIINAVINPSVIKIPEIKIPEVNVKPPEINISYSYKTADGTASAEHKHEHKN